VEKQKVVKGTGCTDDLLQSVAGTIFNLSNNLDILGDLPQENDKKSQRLEDGFYRGVKRSIETLDRDGLPMENPPGEYVEDNYELYRQHSLNEVDLYGSSQRF
jgi:hypothetical protein